MAVRVYHPNPERKHAFYPDFVEEGGRICTTVTDVELWGMKFRGSDLIKFITSRLKAMFGPWHRVGVIRDAYILGWLI